MCIISQGIDLQSLDDGRGFEETLKGNGAKWQKSCRNRCNKLKCERATRKRKSIEDECEGVKTRSKVPCTKFKSVCFQCESDEGILHHARTMKISKRVQTIATELQDSK